MTTNIEKDIAWMLYRLSIEPDPEKKAEIEKVVQKMIEETRKNKED